MLQSTNEMGMDPFVVFPAEWAAAGFEIQYKSVIAWDLGLEQIRPISDFAL